LSTAYRLDATTIRLCEKYYSYLAGFDQQQLLAIAGKLALPPLIKAIKRPANLLGTPT
jgi:hypothetical protein